MIIPKNALRGGLAGSVETYLLTGLIWVVLEGKWFKNIKYMVTWAMLWLEHNPVVI